MPIVPNSRPRLSQEALHALIAPFNVDRAKWPLMIIGIRGYYLDSMGEKGTNEVGIFDDALFLDTPNVTLSVNGNTDPTRQYPGVAILKPGLYFAHRFDLHRGHVLPPYPAICQRAANVTVIRNGKEDTGMFGINIHHAGVSSTSSEGCQTVYAPMWSGFYETAKSEQIRLFGEANWQHQIVPYLLIENTGQI